jgi:hypothetical protein
VIADRTQRDLRSILVHDPGHGIVDDDTYQHGRNPRCPPPGVWPAAPQTGACRATSGLEGDGAGAMAVSVSYV